MGDFFLGMLAGAASAFVVTNVTNKVCNAASGTMPAYCNGNTANFAILGVPTAAGFAITGNVQGALGGVLGIGLLALSGLRGIS